MIQAVIFFQPGLIRGAKRIRLIRIHVQHPDHVARRFAQGHHDFTLAAAVAGHMARKGVDIGHQHRGFLVDRGPAHTLGTRQHGAGQGALVWAHHQLPLLEQIETRPEKMRHLGRQQRTGRGHAGDGILGLLGPLVQKLLQLAGEAVVACGKLVGGGGHGGSSRDTLSGLSWTREKQSVVPGGLFVRM